MTNFTPIPALIGGALIGLSVAMMMLFVGRITGISGIFGGVVVPQREEFSWRATFVAGLLFGGVLLTQFYPQAFPASLSLPLGLTIVSGLLVGLGTRMGSGCTSGHGICGLARFSPRSLVAVPTFMLTAAITVYVMRHVVAS